MTIKVTKTQTVEENVEVTLPAFRKYGDHFYKVESENKYVQVTNYENNKGAFYDENRYRVLDFLEDDTRYEPITEEEFDAAFNQAMNQLKQYQKEAV